MRGWMSHPHLAGWVGGPPIRFPGEPEVQGTGRLGAGQNAECWATSQETQIPSQVGPGLFLL